MAKHAKPDEDDDDFPVPEDEEPDNPEEVEEAADPRTEVYYPVEYSITSYGADYPVDGLVKRINKGSIYVPKFQRGFVWNLYRASRFVESLLLGLPVPAIFLSKELDSNKLLVIDGQQRLRTLQYFYNGTFEPSDRTFKLRGVHARFNGATYKSLHEDDRLRLDDSVIHAIVVKQEDPKEENEPGSGPSSMYHIFERLNTGGMLLQPQEIRTCVYHGPFIELLEEMNKDEHWRILFGRVSSRMRDRELILRFLALYHNAEKYEKPMKEFLNEFASKHRRIKSSKAEAFTELFTNVVCVIDEAIGKKAFRTTAAVNAALFDAVAIGVARRLDDGEITSNEDLLEAYDGLTDDDDFKAAISANTTDEANVSTRLRLATEAFQEVP